jgi:hypothetical protein
MRSALSRQEENRILGELQKAANEYDRLGVDDLVRQIEDAKGPCSSAFAIQVLKTLQQKRFFQQMARLADRFQQAGISAPEITRRYGQALIELGQLRAAVAVLDPLLTDDLDQRETREAWGLCGRAYKQMFVDFEGASEELRDKMLMEAVRCYDKVYRKCGDEALWQGINVAALVVRASEEKITLGEAYSEAYATQIASHALRVIQGKTDPDTWDKITAAEAQLVLDKEDKQDRALLWARQYVQSRDTDAFELASTLRQFQEIWRMTDKREPGAKLLTLLRAHLIQRSNSTTPVTKAEVETADQPTKFEKAFAPNDAVTLASYRAGLRASTGVARIEASVNGETRVGTGFLVKGSDIKRKFGDGPILVTAAHVVCGCDAEDIKVSFEIANFKSGVKAIRAVSLNSDVAYLRLEKAPSRKVAICEVSPKKSKPSEMIYVVGHPYGQQLTF